MTNVYYSQNGKELKAGVLLIAKIGITNYAAVIPLDENDMPLNKPVDLLRVKFLSDIQDIDNISLSEITDENEFSKVNRCFTEIFDEIE